MIIGYTTGVYDLFHVGHLNLLKNAKGMCDKLVVGVTVDELVSYKGKRAFIPFEDRIEIVRSIKYVDAAVPQYDMDKLAACKKLGATMLFVGDDWYGTEKWHDFEEELSAEGVEVVYFPYTKGVSSTKINRALAAVRENSEERGGSVTVDRRYCMSSYLAFRYIERDGVEFAEGLRHENFVPKSGCERVSVRTCEDIDSEIRKVFDGLRGKRLGIMLSGGMDSGSLAAYMPGCDAYTFRFLGGEFQSEELTRAESFASRYGLKLHYVDIDWDVVEANTLPVMRAKGAPVHSIEPQILQAALQAKRDGVEHMIVGESADLIFGGMDKLIGRDWDLGAFERRYSFTDPAMVLKDPADTHYLYERYRVGDTDKIDFLRFMDEVFSVESSGSYMNAFAVAGMPYTDPYAGLVMADPLDLDRVRNGEPKYLVRALFHSKYPDLPIPDKTPMPRPVDAYFESWGGGSSPRVPRRYLLRGAYRQSEVAALVPGAVPGRARRRGDSGVVVGGLSPRAKTPPLFRGGGSSW